MNITFWGIVKSSLPVIWNLWPVWLMVIAIIIIKIMMEIVLPREFREIRNLLNFKRGKDWRSDRDLLQWLRAMKPSEFEEYISTLFSKLGFKTKTVGGAYDGGIDVVAEKDFEKVAKSIAAKIEDEFTSSEDVPEIKTLDRKKVKEIIVDIDNEEDFDYAVDKICELAIPKSAEISNKNSNLTKPTIR